ncbi:MAG: hypothetical protein KF729_29645 [Sandaracinaceae bacterium]|nr:hypothetical protein [Sandaracinaceae bacterium]
MRALALALGLALAPLQCGTSARGPDFEDSPGQALWELSERFESEGDEAARRRTLEHLIERYPSSRFAERARVALGQAR